MSALNPHRTEWPSPPIYKHTAAIKCSHLRTVMSIRDRKKMCIYRINRLGEIIRIRLVIIQRENSWLGAQRNDRVLPGKLQTILSSETLNSGKVLKKSCQTRHLSEILREGEVSENLKVPLGEIHQLRKILRRHQRKILIYM